MWATPWGHHINVNFRHLQRALPYLHATSAASVTSQGGALRMAVMVAVVG